MPLHGVIISVPELSSSMCGIFSVQGDRTPAIKILDE
jgi:hypothetical protein